MAKKIVETPLMKQYVEMKKKHPDAVLLFRVGDFYETFSDDALTASSILGITLTRRANGSAQYVELAGFPHHALDTYLPKLIRAGKRVAICEQLEDPKLTKKLVKRGITELVTPGVNISDAALSERENNFLAGLHFGRNAVGVAFLDISTGEFLCAQGMPADIEKLLGNIDPKELLTMHGTRKQADAVCPVKCARFELDDWIYTRQAADDRLLRHFGTGSLKGFGVDHLNEAVIAAGSLLHYLDATKHNAISHISQLSRIDGTRYVHLDRFSIRNLELNAPLAEGGKCLVDVLDFTASPMGARLLRRWVVFPLTDKALIDERLEAVEYFFRDTELRDRLHECIGQMGDMERLVAKAAVGRVSPRDLVTLKNSLYRTDEAASMLRAADCDTLRQLGQRISPTRQLADAIAATVRDDAPVLASRGNYIAAGVNEELDRLRDLAGHGKEALNRILAREIEQTGITSLKISFNNVFGYYIEVRNTHRDKVPETWIRKQTLVNAERYITPELKEYEQQILGAEDRIQQIEAEIFGRLVERVAAESAALREDCAAIARADVLAGFALAARDYNYVRPAIDESLSLQITEGRHPVIERRLGPGEPYISNSVELDPEKRQIMMITGPNMSGKSALLRQTALIVLMAQMGSFVPAESARIGIVDKIFTRVGASDNISQGESTFMVEMNEAASIINNMSERSLIIFDELGRGTSTYDGISIAWAIVEHIHENGRMRPKTLFATHYHELNEMERTFRRVANFNVSVEEIGGKVVFLRKLRPGGSEHSFGIHVARLAGMPPSIVRRAGQVLSDLESAGAGEVKSGSGKPAVEKPDMKGVATHRAGYQLSFFQLDDPLLGQMRDRLLNLDIDNLTPLQALTTLHELKSLLKGK